MEVLNPTMNKSLLKMGPTTMKSSNNRLNRKSMAIILKRVAILIKKKVLLKGVMELL